MTTIPDNLREQAKVAIRSSSFDIGAACTACGGTGKTYPGRRVIHSRRRGFGADWDEQAALDAIDNATDLEWATGLFGPLLVVTEPDGGRVAFEIKPTTEEQS